MKSRPTVIRIGFVLVLSTVLITSMFSEQSDKKDTSFAAITYLNETTSDVFTDYSSFSITKNYNSGPITYLVDRFDGTTHTIILNEFGYYSIKGNEIKIKTNKLELIGEIFTDKIVISGKEYFMQIE